MKSSAAGVRKLGRRRRLTIYAATMFVAASTLVAGLATSRAQSASAEPQKTRTPAVPIPELAGGVVYAVSPAEADPTVKRFLSYNLVLFKTDAAKTANLLVFFPPTGGTPTNSWPFMEAAANAGYRVIGLEYDNASSVPQTCGKNPDPSCSDRFRQKRVFGDNISKDIDDLPDEAIVVRLTKLLLYLDTHHKDEGWGRYLAHGEPQWSRIAVAGHSHGAGM